MSSANEDRNAKKRKEGESADDLQKRANIQAIMASRELSPKEKQLQIQQLMSGRHASPLNITSNIAVANDKPCPHYQRLCRLVAPCCHKIYRCRLCHDEVEDHILPRFEVIEIICNSCDLRQDAKTNHCIRCETIFADYHCNICNLWIGGDAAVKNDPFHCDKCGICRVGGKENFVHCEICCMCIRKDATDHQCFKNKYKTTCPVCMEDIFSSRKPPTELECGHCIHSECFRKLAQFDYRCPICKKSVGGKTFMMQEWASRARDIELQPMPPTMMRKVSILCNDCNVSSNDLNFHFLGVRCPPCGSFNTSITGTHAITNNNR